MILLKIDHRELVFDVVKLSHVFQNKVPVAQSSNHTVGFLAKTGHSPHSFLLVNCIILCIVCVDCVVPYIVCV